MKARQAGFSILALPIFVAVVLFVGISAAVVSSDEEAQQAAEQKVNEVVDEVQEATEKIPVVGENFGELVEQIKPETGTKNKSDGKPEPLPPQVMAEPQEDPLKFCQFYSGYCTGTTVNTNSLCDVNPIFCTQRSILPGQILFPKQTQPVTTTQPVQGNVNPVSDPFSFCNLNPSYCLTGVINTGTLCGQNSSLCSQWGINKGQSIPLQIPIHGNVNPKQNPTDFCKLNPLHCSGNQVNTTTLCASNPTVCATNQIMPGQQIIPQQQVQQNKFVNPLLNPDINPMANPNTNPMVNPKINPYANPNINPYVNPNIFPMGPPVGIPSQLNPYSSILGR